MSDRAARSRTSPTGAAAPSGKALEVSGLTVSLRGEALLENISLSVEPGECLAIVGESGAGKSLLARTLLGLTQAEPRWRVDADELRIAGQELRAASQRQWRALRGAEVGLVLQDALQSLDPLRTIEAEVGEALAIRGVGRGERRRAAIDALDAAGLPGVRDRLRQRSTELSGGMRQRALIASALVGSPSLLVADEPTTALDPTTAARVLELFESIVAGGTALVLISHDLRSVARAADRIAVVDRGRIVEQGETDAILHRPQHPATRALVAAIPGGPKPSPPPDPGAELLRLSGAARRFPAPDGATTGLHPVDLVLRRGEALGVVGESGAGKSTLARILVDAERADAGAVWRAPACRVRLIPQDPVATFDPRWRVDRIVAASIRPPRDGRPAPTPAELLALVGLGPELLRRRPSSLSGGQRQRVAIARALAADPDVLVCDEPVSALDVSTQAGILALLRDLQARGVSIVFVSHDISAVRTVCDRVLVMREGRVVDEGPAERVLVSPRHPYTRELLASAAGIARADTRA